jgi:hypothetical protein
LEELEEMENDLEAIDKDNKEDIEAWLDYI